MMVIRKIRPLGSTHGPQFGIYKVTQILLVPDYPVWQKRLVMENKPATILLHGKHDPVPTVITYIYGDQALVEARKLAEVKFLQAPVYL
jgi:hypothetical protein